MVFYCGLYFALHSGKEHGQLHSTPCQIKLVELPRQRPHLRYTEDISKNHPGGLRGQKVKPKVVLHHKNTDNPEWCFIVKSIENSVHRMPLRIVSSSNFILLVLQLSTGPYHFGRTLSHICKYAGIEGYKTNHSLCATSTTNCTSLVSMNNL